ncbi:tetratricopeptide repeat protein [Elusimicrobiota bacterium]
MNLAGMGFSLRSVSVTLVTLAALVTSAAFSVAGEYDSEIKAHRAIVKSDPTDLDALYRLGNYLAWDERYDEAVDVYAQVIEKEPVYIEAEVGIAKVYAWKGAHEEARNLYLGIIAKKPDCHEAHQGLGSLALWNNDFNRSVEYFKRALEINSGDMVSLKGIGRAYLGKGDRRRAEVYFTRAQIEELKNIPVWILITVLSATAGTIIGVVLLSRYFWRKRKRELLVLELKLLRLGLDLYHQNKGMFPLAIEKLFDETWRMPGTNIEKVYLDMEGFHRGERGYLTDPFGKRYWYSPDTGTVYSCAKGFEKI